MTELVKDLKTFNVRLPRDLWLYIKNISVTTDTSLNTIIINLIGSHKMKIEKKLEKAVDNR